MEGYWECLVELTILRRVQLQLGGNLTPAVVGTGDDADAALILGQRRESMVVPVAWTD